MADSVEWHTLHFSEDELDLDVTLSSGQIFSWHAAKPDSSVTEWRGILADRLYTLKQTSNHEISYKVHPPHPPHAKSEEFNPLPVLIEFLRLNSGNSLTSMLEEWSKCDPVFKKKSAHYKGVRVLRLDPLEALVSFICSANNNISRITRMVHALCTNFGQHIAEIDGQSYHSFPTLESLHCTDCESTLRSLGFGYRAKYIERCVEQILDRGGGQWLHSLRDLEYTEAWKLLKELSGVGPKVADCVCLMGLGHLEAVPVDTHILRVTAQDYGLEVPRSLTDKSYSLVGEHYRTLFGSKAGWAQAVFFASEIQELRSHKRQADPSPRTKQKHKRAKQ